jgi:predicted  nucleic acid-binding Zn-ribbon protein
MKKTQELQTLREDNHTLNQRYNSLFEKVVFLQNELESLQNQNEILDKELKKKTKILNRLMERFDISPNSPFLQN